MLIAFWVLNNITAYTLVTACCGVPLDYDRHQTTNNFEKLLKQEDTKNILKVVTPILLTIGMHIGLTRLLEVGLPNAKYDSEEKLHKEYTGVN